MGGWWVYIPIIIITLHSVELSWIELSLELINISISFLFNYYSSSNLQFLILMLSTFVVVIVTIVVHRIIYPLLIILPIVGLRTNRVVRSSEFRFLLGSSTSWLAGTATAELHFKALNNRAYLFWDACAKIQYPHMILLFWSFGMELCPWP